MYKFLVLFFSFYLLFVLQTLAQNKYFINYFHKAEKYFQEEEFTFAKLYYDSALLKNPNHTASYFKKGLCYFILEDYQSAIKDFNRTISLGNRLALAYSLRADCKMRMGNIDGGLLDLDTTIQLEPNNYDYRVDRGLAFFAEDHYYKALSDFFYAYDLDSTRFKLNYYIGLIFVNLNESDYALKYLKKSLAVDSTNDDLNILLAQNYFEKKDYDLALKFVNQCIKPSDTESVKYYLRALIYFFNHSSEDNALGIADVKTAIQLGSDLAIIFWKKYFEDCIEPFKKL